MKMNRIFLGDFSLNSSTLLVTDPCYDDATSPTIRGRIEGARPGRWSAYTILNKVPGWGTRSFELQVYHESAGPEIGDSSTWMQAGDFQVGVDSGQAGFYDASRFPSDPGEYNDESSTYFRICETTQGNEQGGVFEDFGVTSCSGFGDGGYDCLVLRNADGEIVGAKIIFIDAEEDMELVDSEESLFDSKDDESGDLEQLISMTEQMFEDPSSKE